MASINSRLLVLPVVLLIVAGTLSAQSVATEIGNIERTLGLTTLSAAERREAYVRMAGLHMLSGNIDASARAWREAALADPENRDDRCFLESALCYVNLGEFDAAADALMGILAGGRDTTIARDARYIAALIEAFRGDGAGALYALLGKPEFQEYRPAIYYTFWRLFGDGAYKAQILSEFPRSPEAGIIKNEEAIAVSGNVASVRVSALNRPLWFFYPGRGNVTIGAAVPVPISPVRSVSAGTGVLQTGFFNREENARAMAARLAARGFTAEVSQKPVNGATHWTVTIPAGENANQTMLKLKDAGFESFPVD